MNRTPAIEFAGQLRSARLAALGDAEAFDGVIHTVERLGSFLTKEELGDKGRYGSLHQYENKITTLASGGGTADR